MPRSAESSPTPSPDDPAGDGGARASDTASAGRAAGTRASTLLEICVEDADQGLAAAAAGAQRIELCSRLDLDGLGPSVADWERLHGTGVPTVVMVRLRPGDFVARPGELAAMVDEVAGWRERGAEGVVFGLLDGRGEVDRVALAELVAAAGALETVFHRAFDRVSDRARALEVLAEAGVTRVLTSGGEATAVAGAVSLAELVRRSAGRVAVLAGGGVRSAQVRELVRVSGVGEVHSSARARGRFDAAEVAALARELAAPG